MYKWLRDLNPLVKAILASIALLVLAIVAFTIIINSPFYLEKPWEEPELGEVYSFQDWEINLDYMNLEFSQGTVLLGYQHNKLTGIIIKGDGSYQIDLPNRTNLDSSLDISKRFGDLQAVYLPVTDDLLETIKGNTIFTPASKANINIDYREYFEAEQNLLANLDVYNINRTIHPGESLDMAYLFGNDYDAKYFEHDTVMFSSCDGERTQLISEYNKQTYPPENFYLYTMMYLLVLLVLISVLAYIFTVDIHEDLYKSSLSNRPITIFTIIFASIGFFFLSWIDLEIQLNTLEYSGFFALLAIILTTVHLMENGKLSDIGIRLTNFVRSIIIAVLLSIIILGLSTLTLPSGFDFFQGSNMLYLSTLLFVSFFFQELLLRGFLLGALEKLFGTHRGLAVQIVLFTVINTSLLLITETHQAFGYYFNSTLDILIMPVITATFLGYLYQRTRNIFCPVFLQLFVAILTNAVYF